MKEQGFTIVELLIVIVVITILAVISVVAYTGVQNRARTTKAQSNASSVKKIAEVFYAEHGHYPTRVAQFTNGTAALPPNITFLTAEDEDASLTRENGDNAILYYYTPHAVTGEDTATPSGACIMWYDFSTGFWG